MKKTVMTSALVALGVTALSGSAQADDSKFFAETQFAGSAAGALSYQVIPNLYVGAGLGWGTTSAANKDKNGQDTSRFAISPQVGYSYALSSSLVLWPRLAYNWTSATTTPVAAGSAKSDTAVNTKLANLELSLPLFVKAGGLHFGPSLDYAMAVGSSVTTGSATVKGEGSQSSLGLSFRAGLAF
jgi:opacity protein-like surface antigen